MDETENVETDYADVAIKGFVKGAAVAAGSIVVTLMFNTIAAKVQSRRNKTVEVVAVETE